MAESATIGILRVLLTADSSGFESGLNKAGNAATGWSGRLNSVVPIIQEVGLAIAGVGTSLLGMATDAAESGDKIAKAARETGLSADAYQEFAFAIGQVANITETQLNKAFSNLTNVIGEAAAGSKTAGQALGELGFAQDRIKSGTIGTEEAFERLIQKLREAPTAADAMRLASDLLGERAGPKLAGALREGGEQVDILRKQFNELGLGMSGEALAAAEKWKDQTDTLSRQFAALGREIGEAVLPLLTEDLIPFIQSTVIPALKSFVEIVAGAIKIFQNLPEPIKMVIAAVTGLIGFVGTLTLFFDALALMVAPLLPLFGLTLPGVVASLGTAFLAFITGPVALIGAAIAGLVVIWIKWGDDITRIVSETYAAVKNWLVDQWEGSIFQSFARMLQAMGEFFVALAAKMLEKAAEIYRGVKDWLVDKLAPVFQAIKNFFDPVIALWTAAKDKVIAIATALYTGIKTWLVDKFTDIVNAVKAKIDAVTEFFRVMKEKVVGNSYVREMVEGIDKQIARLDGVMVQPIQKATAASQEMFSGMSKGVQGIVDNLFNAVQGKTTNWSSSFQSIIHGVTGSTQNIFQAMSQSLQQIVGGMFNSLLGQATNWGNMFMGILTNIIGAGINSLVAWGLGQLGRLIGGWIGGGEEGTQVNPARDQFLRQFGGSGTGPGSGFWELGARLEGAVGSAQAEALHAALRQADTMAAFNAAVAAINAALGGGFASTQGMGVRATDGTPDFGNFSPGGVAPGSHELAEWPSWVSQEAPEEDMGVLERVARGMEHGGFGRVTRPTLFLAGEAGPEDYAFSGANKSLGGGLTVQNHFHGDVYGLDDFENRVMDGWLNAVRMNKNSALTRVQSVSEIR